MDAFEQIIGQLLTEDKYWVQYSVKINLTPAEKKLIGRPSTPRPEIDIVALDVKENKVLLLEVKSFLDSTGVYYDAVALEQEQQEGRYKLLTSENYRNVIIARLREDWLQSGHINSNTQVSFGLIAGKIHRNREEDLSIFLDAKGWLFWGPTTIKEKIKKLADKGYENNAVTIAAKLLMRI